jgi:hypothetical protein
MAADLYVRVEGSPKLGVSSAPEALRRFSSSFEGGCSILGCHGDGRLDVRETTPRCSGQHRSGCRFVVREFTNDQPIMGAEGQIPADELTADALEESRNGSSRFSGLAIMPLTASVVKRPREM